MTTTSHDREKLTPVSARCPCPVCGGDHKCSLGSGGLIICGRRDGPEPGFVRIGQANGDPQFTLYRAETDTPRGAEPPPAVGNADWGTRAKDLARDLTSATAEALAAALRIPPSVLTLLPLIGFGTDRSGDYWSFPEADHAGRVTGIVRRYRTSGEKKMMKGGRRGLTVPDGWADRPGPVHVPEGASDTLALTAAGLAAVGRPSDRAGADELARLLAGVPADRPIIAVGENDAKPGGRWPGRDGAVATARLVADALGRTVEVAVPPDGAKDVRAWLTDPVRAGVEWADRGRQLLDRLSAAAEVVEPAAWADPARPTILADFEEADVNDRAVAALGRLPDVYERGREVVRVVPARPAVPGLPPGPAVQPVSPATLRELLARAAIWEGEKVLRSGEVAVVRIRPPDWSVRAVGARGHYPGVRPLAGVVPHPVLRPDGTLLLEPGYDPATTLCYAPVGLPALPVPDRPTRGEAVAAADRVMDLIDEFPFAGRGHRAAWLAALLTVPARPAFTGPVPLFGLDANTRGAGKTTLVNLIALILTGRPAPAAGYTNDEAELRKLVTSLLRDGASLALFDNVAEPLGNGVLDRLLTAETWQDRLLGTNQQLVLPQTAVWFVTGNNLDVRADTARRVLPVRLVTPHERPEEATFRRPDLVRYVMENRAALLTDVLLILRAWAAVGRPAAVLPPWGSFQGWTDVVRQVVVWLGLPDPAAHRVQMLTDGDRSRSGLVALLRALERVDPDRRGLTSGQIADRVEDPADDDWRALRDALSEMMSVITPGNIGYRLRSRTLQVVDGRFLARAGDTNSGVRWVVRPATEFGPDPAADAQA
jgi:putative DNA primase/helicase